MGQSCHGTRMSEKGRHIENVCKMHTMQTFWGRAMHDRVGWHRDGYRLGVARPGVQVCFLLPGWGSARGWELGIWDLRLQPGKGTRGQWQQRPPAWLRRGWTSRSENQGKPRAVISCYASCCSMGLAVPLQQSRYRSTPVFSQPHADR